MHCYLAYKLLQLYTRYGRSLQGMRATTAKAISGIAIAIAIKFAFCGLQQL